MPEPMFKPVYEPPRPDKKPDEEVEELTDADIIEDSGVREIVDLTDEAIEEPEDLEAAEVREPGELQESEVIDAFEIHGFQGIEVAATLEKKNERKGSEARNEDNIIADPDTGLIGVLDGLGGEGEEGAGALASMSAEEKIPERFKWLLNTPGNLASVRERLIDHQLVRKNPQTPELRAQYQKQITEMIEGVLEKDPEMGRKALALIEAFRQTNRAVQETGGMTMATVGFVHQTPDGQKWAVVASTGDSPAMKRRKNGEIVPITKEDSMLNLLLDSGHITEEQVRDLQTNPGKKMNIPFTLDIVQAMGRDRAFFKQGKAQGIELFPVDYKLLKRLMGSSLGAEKADPALSIRRLEKGDTLVIASDGLTDLYETADGETDFQSLGNEFKGSSMTEDLDNVRKATKAKVSAAKDDDDIAIVTARAA